ncbi:MAG: substrate-binding domain-containing protein, partial [SAR324 cluster bacterium]|nr:substrate-binding domain-containing protein [SAR324 cluster bacterium]
IQRALAKGIKVVAFDIYFEDLTNIVTHMAQDDVLLGQMALDALVADFNGQANVGYIYIPGVLPLDKRDTSFTKVKQEYPGIKEIARHGSLESPISTKNADQVKATMQANRNINAYFAPYDEFAKGVVIALRELNMSDKVKVYSADISTVDIRQMTQEGSPWAATAATNPAAIGATGIRALAMKLTGEWLPQEITIPPMLFTQQMLRDNNVQRFNDLFEKFPEFNTVDRASATWIPRDSSGKF